MLKLGALVRFCLLSGVKRTWLIAAHMSAYDPKRTAERCLTIMRTVPSLATVPITQGLDAEATP
jgi:hypothetical protein